MSTKPTPLPLEDFRDRVNRELATVLNDRAAEARAIDPLFGELAAIFRDYMARSGKRLRPYLMYLAYLGYGGRDEAAIIRASLSQELYHNAWLIHDDIIDRDLIRHGGPNIAGSYLAALKARRVTDREHLSTSAALVTGDLSLALAAELILAAPFPPERVVAASRRLQAISFTETGGEMIDVLLPTVPLADITPERLFNLYHYKTAAYSFELPLQIGAMLAGAPDSELAAITRAATPWGIAFQITDDLLGTFVGEHQLGKSVLSDLREGKRTILYILGLQLADTADRRRLKELAGNPKAGYRHLAEMRELLERSGARARTEALAADYAQQSFLALSKLKLHPDITANLQQLARYTIERDT